MGSISIFNDYIKENVIPRARMHAKMVINDNPGLTQAQYRELFTESYNKYGDTLSRKEMRAAYREFERVCDEALKATINPQLSKEAKDAIARLNENHYRPYSPKASMSGKSHNEWLEELNNAVDERAAFKKQRTDVKYLLDEAKSTNDLDAVKDLIKANATNEEKIAFVRKYKELQKHEVAARKALINAETAQKNLEQGKPIKSAEESARVFMENPDELMRLEKKMVEQNFQSSPITGNVNAESKKLAENVADSGNKVAETIMEESEKVADTIKDKSKKVGEAIAEKGKKIGETIVEEGEKAARKIGPWGWVAIGAGALIALIAGVSAHNKSKQQLNAVA